MFFFFNDTATTEIYTLSLHDALPICCVACASPSSPTSASAPGCVMTKLCGIRSVFSKKNSTGLPRSEEHTSELQSQSNLVCRLLLEKKKNKTVNITFVLSDGSCQYTS